MDKLTGRPRALRLREDLSYSTIDGDVVLRNETGDLLMLCDIPAVVRSSLKRILSSPDGVIEQSDVDSRMLDLLEKHRLAYTVPQSEEPSQSRTAEWIANITNDYGQASSALASKKVAILGIGGLGSIVAHQLCQTGARDLFVVDHGLVNPEDFNRQSVYTAADVGMSKVTALAQRLGEAYPNVRITPLETSITGSRKEVDLLLERSTALAFLCIDEPAGVAARFVRSSIGSCLPLLCAGVGLTDGFVSPLLVADLDKERYVAEHGRPTRPLSSSLAMTNGVIASFMAYRGFRFLIDPGYRPALDMHVDFE